MSASDPAGWTRIAELEAQLSRAQRESAHNAAEMFDWQQANDRHVIERDRALAKLAAIRALSDQKRHLVDGSWMIRADDVRDLIDDVPMPEPGPEFPSPEYGWDS